MYLTIHPDGRTFRHDSQSHDEAGIAYRELSWSYSGPNPLMGVHPLAVPLADGGITLWVDERTVTHAEGLRNIPASLLMPQFDTPSQLLAGTVVVTSSGSTASAFVEDARWSHIEGLVEDITRTIHGLNPIHAQGMPSSWPHAVRLAGVFLEAIERKPASEGVAPYDHLMRSLAIGILP